MIILANTYHLMLRPGAERVERLGGVRRMMGWDGPLLTDSGGFQVMSLGNLRKIDADGVTFKSHIDGSSHRLTPQRSTDISACWMPLLPWHLMNAHHFPAEHDVAAASMRLVYGLGRTMPERVCDREGYGQFGIVQGSVYPDLRAESIERLEQIDFEGYAVGGLAVGEGQEAMFATLDTTTPLMRADKPRYLMGVG
jgi:queuine tRNA-ribosyltransferase